MILSLFDLFNQKIVILLFFDLLALRRINDSIIKTKMCICNAQLSVLECKILCNQRSNLQYPKNLLKRIKQKESILDCQIRKKIHRLIFIQSKIIIRDKFYSRFHLLQNGYPHCQNHLNIMFKQVEHVD